MGQYRLYLAHVLEPGRPLRATSKTFAARTEDEAYRKAEKFVLAAQLHHMGFTVRRESLGDTTLIGERGGFTK